MVTTMNVATRPDILAALGPLDDIAVAEIIGMGATQEELAEAEAWLSNDEALINDGRPMPAERIGRLIEIAAEFELEKDEASVDPERP
jgi:hypothetical protein